MSCNIYISESTGPINVDFTMSWNFPYEYGLNDTNNPMYQIYSKVITTALGQVLGYTGAGADLTNTAWIFSRPSTGSGLNVTGKNVAVHNVTDISVLQEQLNNPMYISDVSGLISIKVEPAGRSIKIIGKKFHYNLFTHS